MSLRRSLFALPLLLALGACGGGGSASTPDMPAPAPAAVISAFSAAPASITSGAQATLTWTASNASSLSISPAVGTVTGQSSATVSPTSTTQYTLTATNADGASVTRTTTVTVSAAAPPPPVINAFTATPTSITSGQSSTLAWTVTGADGLTLDNGLGTVTGTASRSVSPTVTTRYTLTASNSAGTATATATVTVGSAGTGRVYGSMAPADLGALANLNNAVPFPASNAWNTDISAAPVDPNSANLIASIGLNTGLHPDFSASGFGIPYNIVSGSQARVAINFTAYGDESDPGPYPIPPDALVESGGDSHVIVIDKDNNRLYELFVAAKQPNGSWNADAGAVFHLDSNTVRPTAPAGWTSADAAGLPIFPGLVRYDEAARGVIPHALRFTVVRSRNAYVPPASHAASNSTDVNLPPMGMRVRLKASYVIPSGFTPEVRAMLQAMKTYGMIVADNGSSWYVTGAPDPRWNDSRLNSELAQVKGSDFEVLRMDGLVAP